MKRRVASLLLVLVLVMAVLPVTASANAAKDIVVYGPGYTDGSLTSITAEFSWTSATVSNAQLVLMSKPLSGSKPGQPGWGNFSDAGNIFDLDFDDYDDAKSYNGNVYGLITASGNTSVSMGQKGKTITLNFADHPIAPTDTAKYYVYLWVKYRGSFYPDNLICVIQFRDGKLFYTPGIPGSSDFRNHYEDSATSYKEVTDEKPGDSNVTPPPSHICVKSNWITNATHHWRLSCTDPGCPESNTRAAAITDHGKHVYTDGRDPDCNVCGYTRTIPTTGPDTGDITNIPLWTMLFFAGIALMYVQLTQRKREQF